MRFAILVLALAAISSAAPAGNAQNGLVSRADNERRSPVTDLIQILLSLFSGLRGGRGVRGGHPTVPFPKGTHTFKPTTLPATTIAATTLPASTLAATTIGSVILSATTVAATTLAPTTVAASTVPGTTVVIGATSTSTSAAPASTAVGDCVVSSEALPVAATAASTGALPAPTGTFVGSYTGIGHQNYDCSAGNATAAPAAIGANANLTGTCGSGVHSFDNPTTPRFNMTNLGDSTAMKFATMASPDGATNVAWLNLQVLTTTDNIVEVYRVNTQGGVAPSTCGSETGTIQVNYQATYYFYQSS